MYFAHAHTDSSGAAVSVGKTSLSSCIEAVLQSWLLRCSLAARRQRVSNVFVDFTASQTIFDTCPLFDAPVFGEAEGEEQVRVVSFVPVVSRRRSSSQALFPRRCWSIFAGAVVLYRR